MSLIAVTFIVVNKMMLVVVSLDVVQVFIQASIYRWTSVVQVVMDHVVEQVACNRIGQRKDIKIMVMFLVKLK